MACQILLAFSLYALLKTPHYCLERCVSNIFAREEKLNWESQKIEEACHIKRPRLHGCSHSMASFDCAVGLLFSEQLIESLW